MLRKMSFIVLTMPLLALSGNNTKNQSNFTIPEAKHTQSYIMCINDISIFSSDDSGGAKARIEISKKLADYENKKEFNKCIDLLEANLGNTNMNVEAELLTRLAEYYCRVKKFDAALECCDLCINIHSDYSYDYHGYAYYVKALAWMGKGNINMAKEYIRKSSYRYELGGSIANAYHLFD